MKCPNCDSGVMELLGGKDIILKSGKLSKCAILMMRCWDCLHISEWRRTWSNYKMRLRPYEGR